MKQNTQMLRSPAKAGLLALAALIGGISILTATSPSPEPAKRQSHSPAAPVAQPIAVSRPTPTADPLTLETRHLVYVTSLGALASLLVAIVAVGIPMWQRRIALGDEERKVAAQLADDKLAVVAYANYFGEQMEHVCDTKGQLGGACRRALDRVLPIAMQSIGRLPASMRDDAVFAFSNAYKVASQAELDDVRIIDMMESFNQRRRVVADVPSPQSPGILQRIVEDEARFKVSRAQAEQTIANNATAVRKELDAVSRALGGDGIKTRADTYYANPQDSKTDRFRTE